MTRSARPELARHHEVTGLANASKGGIVDPLAGKRKVQLDSFLANCSRDELNGRCQTLGLDHLGREKQPLVEHLIDKKQKAIKDLQCVAMAVGKPGEQCEHVRCVVSICIRTEGWDTINETQRLGARAFRSQLPCEQVAGRGLRRMNDQAEPNAAGFLTVPD